MAFSNLGKVWSISSFEEYLKTIKPPTWAKKICLHHTASPSLMQRPKGYTIQHIINTRDFYKNDLGWNRGPQLFVDDDEIFGLTALTEQGIHAPSFNSNAIGIEVLGNYDYEDPKSGRGLSCWKLTGQVVKALAKWLGIEVNENTIVFHRECEVTKRTTKKSCPGTKVSKDWVLSLIQSDLPSKTPEDTGIIKIGKSFVPVIKYLTENRKINYDVAVKGLKKIKNQFFYNEHLLEFAYYDTKIGATVAPINELEDIFK